MSVVDDLEELAVVDDLRPRVHCKACGAQAWPPPRKMVHNPGCDLDRTVSAATRYMRRLGPDFIRDRAKKRHARRLLAGKCGNCGGEPRPGKKTCQACADYWKARRARSQR